MQQRDYNNLIEMAIREDFDERGDITSKAIFSDELCTADLISKDNGILAGLVVFEAVFKHIDSTTHISFFHKDGDNITEETRIATVSGRAVSVLSAERVALNFLAFLSGIATQTKQAVITSMQAGKALILDTRKTLPGYRKLSKYAVKIGGGTNHRMGLYDMILVKDNHIDAAGSIAEAVTRIKKRWGSSFKIEVECRNISELKQALKNKVDIIMLDNMSRDIIKEAVITAGGTIPLEASGNMDISKIKEMSALGVDYISVGMLTHSVKAFDFSLKVKVDK